MDRLIPPHPAPGLSCGRGVEALVLAILDGHQALSKVGRRLEERGMVALLQPGLMRASLHDSRLGHILDALFAANLNTVLRAVALKALEVYAIPESMEMLGETKKINENDASPSLATRTRRSPARRVKLQLVIWHDTGHEETVTDVITLHKHNKRIEPLG
jgi:Domain of unknown function (DUF4277)